MRKIFMLGVLFIMASAFSIVTDANKDIVGKWKYDEASYPEARKIIIERVRKQSPEQAEQMEAAGEELNQLFSNMTIEYKPDGEFEFITFQGSQGGKWNISADGKYLNRANSSGITRKDSIIEIKPNRMKLFDLDASVKVEFIKAD